MTRAQIWPWGVVIAAVVILVLLAIVVIVLRAARAKVPMVPLASAAAGPDGQVQSAAAIPAVESLAAALALRRSFATAMRRLKELSPRAADRLKAPWVLAFGEAGAGTSSLLDSLELDRLGSAVGESTSPCIWHIFERGVVLDLDGSLVLDPSTGRGDDRAWKTLISLLQRYRPERPADAILLSVPCVDLVGPRRLSREAATEKAARIEVRLAELQRGLGLKLPVYVVVTKCDRIPGFSAFCNSLSDDHAGEMFGWSSPYPVEEAFAPAWVDDAFAMILRGIQHSEFDALARREPVASAGDFLLLPPRVSAAAPALRDFLARVFRPTAWDQGAALRGIYLTGDPVRARPVDDEPMPGSAAERAAGATAEREVQALPVAGTPRRPFLRDLFSGKIFAEHGLARPGARVFPSRNRAVAAMQMATAATILLGPVALWWGDSGIRIGSWHPSLGVWQEAQQVDTLLRMVKADVQKMVVPGVASVDVFPLLGAMANASASHVSSLFLPGSLVSPLHGQVSRAIQTSFQEVLLPELRSGLDARMHRLIDAAAPDTASGGGGAAAMSLPQYVAELRDLGENVGRFDRLSARGTGETRDLVELVHYLYGKEVSQSFYQDDDYYRQALERAHADPISPGPKEQRLALHRAGALAAKAYASLISRMSLGTAGADTSADDESDIDASKADVEAIVGLRAFLDPDGPVQQALAAIQPPFAFGDGFAQGVRDSLAAYTELLTGQISSHFSDGAHTSAATRRALDALLHQHFMQAPTGRAIAGSLAPGVELRWDAQRLDEAIALHTAYEAFLVHGLDSLPDALHAPVRRLATVQLGAAMADAVGAAQVTRTELAGAHQESARDLRGRVTNFEQDSPRVARLIDLFDTIGATEEVDSLAQVSTRQATDILGRLDTAFDLPHRYVLPSSALASWSGRAPFSAAAFAGGRGAFTEYLATEQEAIRSMATLARPAVTFLEARAAAGAVAPRSLRSWSEVVDAVDRLDRKPPAGPLATLERVVVEELDSVDVRSCLRRAPRPVAASDVFSRRVEEFRATIWRRCADVALGSTRAAYARVQDIFRVRLAGRFPFASADAGLDASPADIVEMLRAWDVMAPTAPDLAEASGAATPRLAAFFADMAVLRKFFAPLVDSAGAGRVPLYDFQVDFRVNRTHEVGANQIAEWTADIGGLHAEIGAPVAARRGRWRSGDSAQVTLRWATGSMVVPAAVAASGATVHDGAVVVAAGGAWGLFRLLRAFESDVTDPDGGQSVAVSVRTARRQSPAVATGIARAFVRIRLYDPDTKAELALPRFPLAAPALTADGAR